MPKLVEWDDYDCGLDHSRGRAEDPMLEIEVPGSPLNGAIGYQRGTREFQGQELARVVVPMVLEYPRYDYWRYPLYDIWVHPSRLRPFDDRGFLASRIEEINTHLLWDAVCMGPKGGLIPCILDSGHVVLSDRRHPISIDDENDWS